MPGEIKVFLTVRIEHQMTLSLYFSFISKQCYTRLYAYYAYYFFILLQKYV